MPIDIENPGAEDAALRAAMQDLSRAPAIEVEATGTWPRVQKFHSIPVGSVTLYPLNITIPGTGAWASSISIEEDTPEGLGTLSFPNLVGTTGDFYFSYFIDLASLSAPELVFVGDEFDVYSLASLTNLSAPALRVVCGDFGIAYCNSLVNVEMPALEYIDYLDIYENMALETLEFPALTKIRRIYMYNNPELTTLSFPLVEEIYDDMEINQNSSLSSISLPSIVRLKYVSVSNLTSWTYGENLVEVDGDQNFYSCALDQTSVDHILTTLAGLDGTGGTVAYEGRSVTLNGDFNAIPSSEGLAAIAVLEGRSCVVSFNGP